MNKTQFFEKMLDPYELKARLFPGLLVLLPAITYLALLYGTKSPTVVGLSTVLVACGGPYLLSSFVRTLGQQAQEYLYKKWDSQPSTALLRHRDTQLPQQTKLRYHELVVSRLGITLPSETEEGEDPDKADQAYAAAADKLRPLTNNSKAFPFIFKELVAYGFNRNAYGSRWIGLCIALATSIATLLHAGALHLQPPYLAGSSLDAEHILVLLVAIGLAALWCVHFTAQTVRFAGFSYAKRLWESLEKMPKKRARSPRKGSAGESALSPF